MFEIYVCEIINYTKSLSAIENDQIKVLLPAYGIFIEVGRELWSKDQINGLYLDNFLAITKKRLYFILL
jgi:hypothetical protein